MAGKKPPAPPPPSTPEAASRVRATPGLPDPGSLKTTRERVDYIVRVMDLGLWDRRVCRELTGVWGLSPRRVRDYSAAAHLLRTKDQTEQERGDIRRGYVERLESWAVQQAQEGNHKVAKECLELASKLQGLVTTQHTHEFRREAREALQIAQRTLPKAEFRKYMAALVAAGKGESLDGQT